MTIRSCNAAITNRQAQHLLICLKAPILCQTALRSRPSELQRNQAGDQLADLSLLPSLHYWGHSEKMRMHLGELPSSLGWHLNFMISSFDRAFLIRVFRSVEGVFKKGCLSHSLKHHWPDRSREGLCCRDRAGAQNKKPEGKVCKQLWLGDHKTLGTSSGLLQSHTLSQPKLSVLFSSQLFCRLRASVSKERDPTA